MLDLQTLGKYLLLFAIVLAITGGLLLLAGRLGLGSLPGTLKLQGRGWSCFVPIGASILLSLILTLLLNLLLRWLNR